jgi:hypothetical protein
MPKLAAALLSVLALAVAFPGAAVSQGGAKNVVMVFNEADSLKRSGSGTLVSAVASDSVGSENLAYAKSSCVSCRTVAAALQVVLITSDASVIEPKNAAVAVNENCSSCSTFAGAYQYVITTGGPVHLSAEGQGAVATIRDRARTLAASDLAFPELEESLDALYEELRVVIDEELQRAGQPFAGRTVKHVSKQGG